LIIVNRNILYIIDIIDLKWGPVGDGEKGRGRKGRGVSIQPTRDQSGREFTPRHRRGEFKE
jgi:hypothetical protein